MAILRHSFRYRTRYNFLTYLAVAILSGGFLICYRHEENYHIIGLSASFGAALFRAGKSVVQVSSLLPLTLVFESCLYYDIILNQRLICICTAGKATGE